MHPSLLFQCKDEKYIQLKEIYTSFVHCMGTDDADFKSDYSDVTSANVKIFKQFSHMNAGEDNIFNANSLSQMPCCDLSISPMALKRLIGVSSNGWLEDEVINFMNELCNFCKIFIPEIDIFKEEVPSYVIGKVGDDNN